MVVSLRLAYRQAAHLGTDGLCDEEEWRADIQWINPRDLPVG